MTQNIKSHNLPELVSSFVEAFTIARDGFVKAGKIYAQAIAEYGADAREQFAAAAPGVPASTWRRLELLGTGAMDQRLLTASSTGATSLRRMQPADQKNALDHGVELLTGNGSHLIVQVDALTTQQVRQVFSIDRIRSLPEQRAWLEENAPEIASPNKTTSPAFRVVGGKVRVDRACEISRIDLLRLLTELG